MKPLIPLLVIWPAVAAAQDWALRDADEIFDRSQIVALIEGQIFTFYDDGQSRYQPGGDYSYTYAGGATAFGTYQVKADGAVCVDFQNGWSRCDRYVRNNGRVVLLTEDGERFPVRRLEN